LVRSRLLEGRHSSRMARMFLNATRRVVLKNSSPTTFFSARPLTSNRGLVGATRPSQGSASKMAHA
jgi:hypothetical protein